MTKPARIEKIEAFVFRAPIEIPVQTSFGIMRDRAAVFVRVKDSDGAEGWGEIWCNFPTVGAEHRARATSWCHARSHARAGEPYLPGPPPAGYLVGGQGDGRASRRA